MVGGHQYSLNAVLLQEFFIFHRLERWSVVADYLGWETVSHKDIAGCFCGCRLYWTNHFWPLGVGIDYEKVVVGLVSYEVYGKRCHGVVGQDQGSSGEAGGAFLVL